MYELETEAGTVFSMSESLADALLECLTAEGADGTSSADDGGLRVEDAILAEFVQVSGRVA